MSMSMSMTSMSIGSMSMDECLDLPPGFRFHPTDEELITSYLSPKVANPAAFAATAIGEVDLNKCEPWDLPSKAKMGEKEWYFFCQRDRKYPTGMRTNRATEAGYWKATGKDKEIYAAAKGRRPAALVGMKKTLVFYRGRAPKGDKSNWVMHEYRLESRSSSSSSTLSPKDEWVVCRVFHKSGGNGGGGGGGGGGAKKTPMPGGGGMDQYAALPPLTDYHYYYNAEDFEEATNATAANPSPSSYFSSMMAGMVEDFSGGMVDPTPVSASAMLPPPQSFGFQDPFSSAGAGYLHRQDYYYNTPAPAMRQCKAEEVANNQSVVVSEDTGASTDRNTEISSVVSRQHDVFELDDLVSGAGAEPGLDLDGMWRC